jgi:hypothetical protein
MVRLTPKQVRLINGRHFATVATVMPDGSPEATVVWIESADQHIDKLARAYTGKPFRKLHARCG